MVGKDGLEGGVAKEKGGGGLVEEGNEATEG